MLVIFLQPARSSKVPFSQPGKMTLSLPGRSDIALYNSSVISTIQFHGGRVRNPVRIFVVSYLFPTMRAYQIPHMRHCLNANQLPRLVANRIPNHLRERNFLYRNSSGLIPPSYANQII